MLISFELNGAFRGVGGKIFCGEPDAILGQQTFIYGRNGSGKTTLTDYLRAISTPILDSSITQGETLPACKMTILADGAPKSVKASQGDTPFDFAVYNRYFVRDELDGFLEGSGFAPGVGTIGRDTKAALQRIQKLEETLNANTNRLQATTQQAKLANTQLESLERELKAEIISALSPGDPGKYSTQVYNISKTRRQLSSDSKRLSEPDLSAALVTSSTTSISEMRLDLPSGLPRELFPENIMVNILAKIPERLTIERLHEDEALELWVRAGTQLHSAGNTCKFCNKGIYDAELEKEYGAHFSEEYKALLENINSASTAYSTYCMMLTEFEGRVEALRGADQALIAGDWESAITEALLQITHAKGVAGDVVAALAAKRDDVDSIPTLKVTSTDTVVSATKLLTQISTHNTEVGNFAQKKSDAQNLIEGHYAARSRTEWSRLTERKERLEKLASSLSNVQGDYAAQIAHLKGTLSNTSEIAEQISRDIKYIFGHQALTVAASEESGKYLITRDGRPAQHLSDGERNIIAYTYYLRSLGGEEVDPERTVVVIDDPVTSLDNERLYAQSALTLERTKEFAQTIILTHDFDYYRLLLGTSMPDRKHALAGFPPDVKESVKDKTVPRQSYLEISPSSPTRDGRIRKIPLTVGSSLSEYHFLFHVIGEVVLADHSDREAMLHVNAARRLLEGFIAFRAPSKSTFQDRINTVVKSCGYSIDEVLAAEIVKFLHGGSHRDEPSPLNSLNFSGTRRELTRVLEFISMADPSHFAEMCKAVRIDPEEMLKALAS